MAGAVILRGAFVVVALPGDYGKPRPALVLQSDEFADTMSVTICPLTSHMIKNVQASLIRVAVDPLALNGLEKRSHIMIDKMTTVRRDKITRTIGHADKDLMHQVTRALAVFLGIV